MNYIAYSTRAQANPTELVAFQISKTRFAGFLIFASLLAPFKAEAPPIAETLRIGYSKYYPS